LSLSERIGFNWGFLAAAAGTVALLSVNAAWIFASWRLGMRALIVFGILYTLIFLLLRMEDNALLIGAITSFLATAATMYLTRKVDWYGAKGGSKALP
jgi:inner membrane protein